MAWTLADPNLTHELALQIGVFCAGLFIACMFCHGELARLKPAPRYLTRFYLMISLGGAVGSALVGIVAPLVLPAYFELAGGLVALRAAARCGRSGAGTSCFVVLAVAALLLRRSGAASGRSASSTTTRSSRRAISTACCACRNERRRGREPPPLADPRHDHARHAVSRRPSYAARPTTYYTQTSGIGRLLESLHPRMRPAQGRRHRPRHRHDRNLRQQGRHLSLLRHQPAGDRDRAARFHLSQGQRRRRSRWRWATRASRSSASRRRTSTCSRSTPFRAMRFRCTSSPREALAIYLRHMKTGRRHRLPRDQPLSRSGAGRARRSRDAQGLCGDARSTTTPRTRMTSTQRLGAAVRRHGVARRSPQLAERRDADRAAAATGASGPTTSTTSSRC